MDNSSREQVLADFQSCTGMEDIAECFMALEAAEWNLLDAINSVMPQETQTLPSEQHPPPVIMNNVEDAHMFPSHTLMQAELPSPQASPSWSVMSDDDNKTRLASFTVTYKNNTIDLEIPDTETVGSLKSQLLVEFGVPICKQHLTGWKIPPASDEVRLCELNLSPCTKLLLTAPDLTATDYKESFAERLTHSHQLSIQDVENNRNYQLTFPGSKTLMEIKQDIFDLTNIPVRLQEWEGWPENSADDVTLAALNLNRPTHDLILKKKLIERPKPAPNDVIAISSDESELEEYEDATEGYLGEEEGTFPLPPRPPRTTSRPEPLMPPHILDEKEAIRHFIQQFEKRYGPIRPDFFQGSFIEALQNSCMKPARERRPLAIYIHHDGSVSANVFCSQFLCSETVVTYLNANFVTFCWDVSLETNREQFMMAVSQHMGGVAVNTVQHLEREQFPAIMIVTRLRSAGIEMLTLIPCGLVQSLDDLMTRLMHASEVFTAQITTEIEEDEKREAREQVKREQDAAYEESLKADRAKEEARIRKEEMEQLERQRQMEKQKMDNEIKEAIRLSLFEQVPPEPPAEESDISQIRIRFPTGETTIRRFYATDSLKGLLTFLAAKGFPPEEYKVLSSWPRRDLTGLDHTKTLKELNIYPQDTLTLEER